MPVKVRLNRKLANLLNGIDLSKATAGEEIQLSARDAQLLVAEGWASLIDSADDRPPRRRAPAKRRHAK